MSSMNLPVGSRIGPDVGPFEAAAGGSTVSLAGRICGMGRVFGALVTAVALSGTVRSHGLVAADIETAVPLQGRVVAISRAYGQAYSAVSLVGTIKAHSRLYGNAASTTYLTGAVKSTSRAYGQLETTIPLQGQISSHSRLYGIVVTGTPLAGVVRVHSRLYGSLVTSVALSGRIVSHARLYGQLETSVPIQGTIRAHSRLYGDVSTAAVVALSGQIVGHAKAYGNAVTSVALTGRVVSTSRAYGQLVTSLPLSGGTARAMARLYGNAFGGGPQYVSGWVLGHGRAYGNLVTGLTLRGAILAHSRVYGRDALVTLTTQDPYDNTLVDSEAEIETPKALIPAGLSTTIRPGALTFDYLLAYTLGPAAIGSAPEGVLGYAWYVRAEGNTVYYARSNDAYDNWQGEAPLFTFSGAPIIELDCAFEQNGRIVVVAERATGSGGSKELWIYWYKPSLAAFTFESFGPGRTPRVVLDNPNDTAISDIHVAYMSDGVGLVTRRQSELYATEHTSVFTDSTNWYVEEFARNRGNRLVVVLSKNVGDRWYLDRIESTLYPFYPTDTATFNPTVLSTSELIDLLVEGYADDAMELGAGVDPGSTLAIVILSSEPQDDAFEFTPSVETASTLQIVVLVSEPQDDAMDLTADVLTTSTLVVVIIVDYSDDDEDISTFSASVLNTSTLA